MSVKDLPLETRPREKLLARGPGALSDAELLALLLRTGIPGKGVLKLAEELLQLRPTMNGNRTCNHLCGIAGLLQATPEELGAVKGMGPAKRTVILAVLEIARRATGQQMQHSNVIADPSSMKQYLQLHIAQKPYEVFAVCFLNCRNQLIAMEEMFRGTINQTSVHPREVAKRALHHGAVSVVLAHNHPSGSVQPSRADEALTQTLKAALALLDVRVLDHIIVAPGVSLSMAERGLM
jgi:DNA repair protein RadC